MVAVLCLNIDEYPNHILFVNYGMVQFWQIFCKRETLIETSYLNVSNFTAAFDLKIQIKFHCLMRVQLKKNVYNGYSFGSI